MTSEAYFHFNHQEYDDIHQRIDHERMIADDSSLEKLCRKVDILLQRHETSMQSLHHLISQHEQRLLHRTEELRGLVTERSSPHQQFSEQNLSSSSCQVLKNETNERCAQSSDSTTRETSQRLRPRASVRPPPFVPPSLFRARRLEWMQIILALMFGIHLLTTSFPLVLDPTASNLFFSTIIDRISLNSLVQTDSIARQKSIGTADRNQLADRFHDRADPAYIANQLEIQKSKRQWKSPPPPVLNLLETDNPSIQHRHKCIRKIRERQHSLLIPFLPKSVAANSILLVDPAYHSNVGDHMITLGELEFMKRLGFPTEPYDQCHFVQANNMFIKCDIAMRRLSENQKYALWHGGGNWGDLWGAAQRARIGSFEKLLSFNYTVISMPQSLYYTTSTRSMEEENLVAESVGRGLGLGFRHNDTRLRSELVQLKSKSRLILTWREHESYNAAMKLYPYATNLLVPDIAFQLGPYAPITPKDHNVEMVDFVLLLRDDKESTIRQFRNATVVLEILSSLPSGSHIRFVLVDWNDRLSIFKSRNFLFTITSVQLLSMGRVVITDRLHAAILAYLIGLPFIYINQSTGKISKTLRVAFDSWKGCEDREASRWKSADDLRDALLYGIQFLHKYELE